MILNEIERAVICGTREYRTNAEFIDAIEGAVLNKLCAGVSMPEAAGSFHVTHFKQSACMRNIEFQEHVDFASGDHLLYTADQLSAYGAACRVKALEDCLNEIEGWANDQFELKAAIRAMKGES